MDTKTVIGINSDKSTTVKQVSLLFSLGFLFAVPFAVFIFGEEHLFGEWLKILSSPCPLITDYFALGSLPAAFLNAGLCGIFWSIVLFILDDDQHTESEFAGYFLVVAHCFYGLNFFNMLSPVLGMLVSCKVTNKNIKDNIHKAMFSTAFGPFISELTFRYHTALMIEVNIGTISFNIIGLLTSLLLGLFLGFVIPPMLEGAKSFHRGYNLYNGGLAFGLLGLFISAFVFKSFGKVSYQSVTTEIKKTNYRLFCTLFFIVMFLICFIIGYIKNGRTLNGYGKLMKSAGYKVQFIEKFGPSLTWINLGIYGFMMVAFFNIIIASLDGVGWTGATCGVTLAAVAFAAAGQHPKNVWPILAGFVVYEITVSLICFAFGISKDWTLSYQSYINAMAFATGLCPFTGQYGNKIGIIAGFMCAVMCTSTSSIHCGLMLYNGGFTAGITAMLLAPILEYYNKKKI